MEPAVVDIITQQATKPMKLAEYFCTGPSKVRINCLTNRF
jgi:hypothetical protein